MSKAKSPKPAAIRAAREVSGLTQTQAAALVYSTLKTWQDWESGRHWMHAGLWELWLIKAFDMTWREVTQDKGSKCSSNAANAVRK